MVDRRFHVEWIGFRSSEYVALLPRKLMINLQIYTHIATKLTIWTIVLDLPSIGIMPLHLWYHRYFSHRGHQMSQEDTAMKLIFKLIIYFAPLTKAGHWYLIDRFTSCWKIVKDMDVNLVLWSWSTHTCTHTKICVLVFVLTFSSTRTRTHDKQSTLTHTRVLCIPPSLVSN